MSPDPALLDELPESLRATPDRPALLTTRWGRPAVRITGGELVELADAYAAGLHQRGLAPGETVGFAVRPGPHAIALMLAACRLRLRIAVLDPHAGPDVLVSRLVAAQPRLVVADAAAQAVAGWARPLARRAHLALPDLSAVAPVATVGRRPLWCAPSLAIHNGQSGLALPNRRGLDGDAVMIFTSGTTGRPRAVVHTWRSLDAGMRAVADLVQPRPGATVLGGTFFVLIPSLASGASVALPARSARRLARQLRVLRPDETYLTPPQLRDVLVAWKPGGPPRFTGRVWTGSAPASADLLMRVREAGATAAHGVYALTEMFPVAVTSAQEKASYDGPGDLVGRLLPGVTARTEPDGQLLLAGPNAYHRYLGDEPSAWVRTGDIAQLTEGPQGTQVVLAGRAKDMILRGAENIYPGLYEPSLHVPGVALAVLVGVPASDGDERLVALVQTEAGADPRRVDAALRPALARMGAARPDAVVFAPVPLAGRSRKPDRVAAARLAAARVGGP
jgi:acyl-CoA synthetase (AMP-forming)/AMP-acid ligase II